MGKSETELIIGVPSFSSTPYHSENSSSILQTSKRLKILIINVHLLNTTR